MKILHEATTVGPSPSTRQVRTATELERLFAAGRAPLTPRSLIDRSARRRAEAGFHEKGGSPAFRNVNINGRSRTLRNSLAQVRREQKNSAEFVTAAKRKNEILWLNARLVESSCRSRFVPGLIGRGWPRTLEELEALSTPISQCCTPLGTFLLEGLAMRNRGLSSPPAVVALPFCDESSPLARLNW